MLSPSQRLGPLGQRPKSKGTQTVTSVWAEGRRHETTGSMRSLWATCTVVYQPTGRARMRARAHTHTHARVHTHREQMWAADECVSVMTLVVMVAVLWCLLALLIEPPRAEVQCADIVALVYCITRFSLNNTAHNKHTGVTCISLASLHNCLSQIAYLVYKNLFNSTKVLSGIHKVDIITTRESTQHKQTS